MKVYELMAQLADCDAGNEVRVTRCFTSTDVARLQQEKEMPSYDGPVIEIDENGEGLVYLYGGESL